MLKVFLYFLGRAIKRGRRWTGFFFWKDTGLLSLAGVIILSMVSVSPLYPGMVTQALGTSESRIIVVLLQ
jgi:hypothetical protein